MATYEQQQFTVLLLDAIGESVTATIGGTPYSVSAIVNSQGMDEIQEEQGGTTQISVYTFALAISQTGDTAVGGYIGGTIVYEGVTYKIQREIEHVPFFDKVTVEAVADTLYERAARGEYRRALPI